MLFGWAEARFAVVRRMNLRQIESRRTVRAPAKLNLRLEVLWRREDGYHELETLLVPLRWCDTLSLTPLASELDGAPGPLCLNVRAVDACLSATNTQGDVPSGPDLVVRALELLRARSGCRLGARVELVKRIPSGAGLGGGSSDAAAALRLTNWCWGLHWGRDRLTELAAELGSDVPFFLSPGAAICRGRGERVERLSGVVPLDVVIVKPPVGLGTADVYRALDAHRHEERPRETTSPVDGRPGLAALVDALRRGTLSGIGQWMGNRLQAAAVTLSPWIERIEQAFDELDFLGHQLSGSGSAYFGICRHAQHARRLASILRMRQLGLVYVTHSCR